MLIRILHKRCLKAFRDKERVPLFYTRLELPFLITSLINFNYTIRYFKTSQKKLPSSSKREKERE